MIKQFTLQSDRELLFNERVWVRYCGAEGVGVVSDRRSPGFYTIIAEIRPVERYPVVEGVRVDGVDYFTLVDPAPRC